MNTAQDANTPTTRAENKRKAVSVMESASYWTGVAAVAFTALAAVAGTLAWYFSLKVGDTKDAELERFKEESRTAIASSNATVATAKESAAKALAEGSAANERSIGLALDVEKQRERAAKAETTLLELQDKIQPRHLDPALRGAFVKRLAAIPGKVPVQFHAHFGDPEAMLFANDLKRAFDEAGWISVVHAPLVIGLDKAGIGRQLGLHIVTKTRTSAVADALMQAFHDGGQTTTRAVFGLMDANMVYIEVGGKAP